MTPPPLPTTTTTTATDYYYYSNSRANNSPSPVIVFPASSPTPKLSCNTPSKKPVSPFDWARECMLDDQQEAAAASGWNKHHFDEMERIGKELERGDALALERLREKANPTPEERCVLSWIDSSLQQQQQQQQPSPCSPSPLALASSSNSSSSTSLNHQEEHQQQPLPTQPQQKPATNFLAFLNRFKKSLKLQ